MKKRQIQWRFQDFPDGGGGRQPQRGTPTYYLANFQQKLHENKDIWAMRGRGRISCAFLDPPMKLSIEVYDYLRLKQYLISISLNPFVFINVSGKTILSTDVGSSNCASLRPGSPGTSSKLSWNVATESYFSNLKLSNYFIHGQSGVNG